jgi:phosphatidylglycerol---prolipoprotein diacylglyceryl transferase
MWPFHLRLGPFAVAPGEILVFLGIALVAVLARPRLRALGLSDGGILDLTLAALVGGAIGARLYYFVPLWIRGAESASTLFTRWSDGSGFYGGLVCGLTAVALLAWRRKQPVLDILDAGFVPFPLGFAVGKLGCFLAGCCYGRRCDGFPGVGFRPGSLAYQTQLREGAILKGATSALPVQPTQLYELAFGLLLFGALVLLRRRRPPRGTLACAFLSGYALWRFGIEFFRDDPGRHGFNAGISDSQVMALVVFAASAVAWVLLRQRVPERRSTL